MEHIVRSKAETHLEIVLPPRQVWWVGGQRGWTLGPTFAVSCYHCCLNNTYSFPFKTAYEYLCWNQIFLKEKKKKNKISWDIFTCKQRPWVQASVASRAAHSNLLEDLIFTNTWSSAPPHPWRCLTTWVWSGAWTGGFSVLPQASSTELSLRTRTILHSFLLIEKSHPWFPSPRYGTYP